MAEMEINDMANNPESPKSSIENNKASIESDKANIENEKLSIEKDMEKLSTGKDNSSRASSLVPPSSPIRKSISPGRVSFNRPPPGNQLNFGRNLNTVTIHRQFSNAMNRLNRFLPSAKKVEPWKYATGFVIIYTLLMLFSMSTFGFICIMVYTLLITTLVLRYFGLGPLSDPNPFRFMRQ